MGSELTAASPRPMTSIELAFQELSEVASSLDIRASDLTGILAPVMAPATDNKPDAPCRPPYPVPLASAIQNIADRLNQTNRALSEIMDRLDFRS